MAVRGWTAKDIEDVIAKGATGKSTDDRSASKTSDGFKRNDPATVYGEPPGRYIVINDRTKELVQVGGKNDPDWISDGRIKWK